MSILDSVINPAELRKLDPAVRRQIVAGVEAGARAAAAVEGKRFSPAISRRLTTEAKTAIRGFSRNLKKVR